MIGLIRRKETSYDLVDHFIVDSEDEISKLPTTSKPGKDRFDYIESSSIGSDCIVGNKDGKVERYILFGFGWKKDTDNMLKISEKLELLNDGEKSDY